MIQHQPIVKRVNGTHEWAHRPYQPLSAPYHRCLYKHRRLDERQPPQTSWPVSIVLGHSISQVTSFMQLGMLWYCLGLVPTVIHRHQLGGWWNIEIRLILILHINPKTQAELLFYWFPNRFVMMTFDWLSNDFIILYGRHKNSNNTVNCQYFKDFARYEFDYRTHYNQAKFVSSSSEYISGDKRLQ